MKRGKWFFATFVCIFLVIMLPVAFAKHSADTIKLVEKGEAYSFQSFADGSPSWDPSYTGEWHDARYISAIKDSKTYTLQSIMDNTFILWTEPPDYVMTHPASDFLVDLGDSKITVQQYINDLEDYLEELREASEADATDDDVSPSPSSPTGNSGIDSYVGQLASITTAAVSIGIGILAVIAGSAAAGIAAVGLGVLAVIGAIVFG